MYSSVPLPPAKTRLDQPLLHGDGADHSYSLPPNTAGRAAHLQRRRRRPTATTTAEPTVDTASIYASVAILESEATVETEAIASTVEVAASVPSRTTEWRRKRSVARGIIGVYKKHKAHYSCRKCGQPSTAQKQ